MEEKFRLRRFILASIFAGTACIGFGFQLMGAGELIGMAGVVLALYGSSEAMNNYTYFNRKSD